MDKRRSCANFGSMEHHVSACSTYKQNLKAIGYFHTDMDHKVLLLQFEGTLQVGLHSILGSVADGKHPRHEEALSGVKASRARPMNEAESRRKETTPSSLTTKKV